VNTDTVSFTFNTTVRQMTKMTQQENKPDLATSALGTTRFKT